MADGIDIQMLKQQVEELEAQVSSFNWQLMEIHSKPSEDDFHEDAAGDGKAAGDYDPDTGTYGTLTYNKPIHMVWWDADYSTSGAYEELLEAAGTTYTGEGAYLCVKLDLTAAYDSRWSVARYTTNKVADSDPDVALYWCLGQIVDNEFVEWTLVIEHMGS